MLVEIQQTRKLGVLLICTSLSTLFVEPTVGKACQVKLEENLKSCMIHRHVYSLWAGTGSQ